MVKTATNPQLTYRFNTILIRILAGMFVVFFFPEIDKFKIHMEIHETQNSQNIIEKEKQSFRMHIFNFVSNF